MSPKATGFDEITQINGHYVIQGHSRSPILVPIESLCATSYYWTYLVSCTVSTLWLIIRQIFPSDGSLTFNALTGVISCGYPNKLNLPRNYQHKNLKFVALAVSEIQRGPKFKKGIVTFATPSLYSDFAFLNTSPSISTLNLKLYLQPFQRYEGLPRFPDPNMGRKWESVSQRWGNDLGRKYIHCRCSWVCVGYVASFWK